jgi:phosphoglycerol transferase
MDKVIKWVSFGCKVFVLLLVAVIATFGVFFNRGMNWMHHTWPHLNMDELTFMLRNQLGGTSPEIVSAGIRAIVPISAVILVAVITCLILIFKKKILFTISSIFFAIAGIIIFSITTVEAVEQLEIVEHIERQAVVSEFLGETYVVPQHTPLAFPEEKRNLIYIFVESTEVTFTDYDNGGAMSFNAIPELTQLAHDHEDFSGDSPFINGAMVLPGGSWTIAGMFSQTSGLPWNINVPRNAMDQEESFFPEILTLGRILEEQGYYQGLLVGSDAVFGGRELFYTNHGNFTIWDYYYAHDNGLIPYGHRVWWGFEDWRLFDIGREKLLEMAEGDDPFHLTMLTVDTHFPHGWVCEYCPNEFHDQMANVFLCGSRQVYEFVNWIKEQDFFENTTIIVAGDHLTMDRYFAAHVPEDYQRRTFVSVINAPIEVEDPTRMREFSTLDMFPTTLAALGVEIYGNRLGLGTNLFSAVPTLLETYGFEFMANELTMGTDLMDTLAATLDIGTEFIETLIVDFEDDDIDYVRDNEEFITIFPYNVETGILSILIDQEISEYLRTNDFIVSAWSQEYQADILLFPGVRAEDGPVLINVRIPTGHFFGSHIDIEISNVNPMGNHRPIYDFRIQNPHITM